MSKPFCICFLADRHELYDDRIYWKMAVPLSERGFEVHYLLIGNRTEQGVTEEGVYFQIWPQKSFSGNRFLNFVLKLLDPGNNYKKMLRKAQELGADIYHFHDLWINRIAVKLKNLPHRPVVFYDAREPYAEDYLSYVKTSFPFFLRIFARWVDGWEKKKAKRYDLVIANENNVRHNFAKVIGDGKAVTIYNYADFKEPCNQVALTDKKYDLIYAGAITELRGAFEILKAVKRIKMQLPEVRAVLLGQCYPADFKDTLETYINSNGLTENIELVGYVPYQSVAGYYNVSKIGLVLLQRVKTFEISMPIKVFEYMNFGLPVVGSDFGHIKSYIENDDCGITVAPDDHKAVSEAVLRLLRNENLYTRYSQHGKNASVKKYRWKEEFEKLLVYYKKALDERE